MHKRSFLITGASRGIGKAIGLKLASQGANIIIAAKSVKEDPRLGGTIYSAAEEMEKAGGRALAVPCDVRDEEQVMNVVEEAVKKFGGIDGVINNASAINLATTELLDPKRYDLMFDVNVRGTFMVTRACLPYLKKSANAHILTLSPPLNMHPKWLGTHPAYTITKYNMSMLAVGWAAEFKKYKIASNALWPRTTIDTAAVRNLLGGEALARQSRKPSIVADAAYLLLKKSAAEITGKCLIDEDILREAGITSLEEYSVEPGAELFNDLFVD